MHRRAWANIHFCDEIARSVGEPRTEQGHLWAGADDLTPKRQTQVLGDLVLGRQEVRLRIVIGNADRSGHPPVPSRAPCAASVASASITGAPVAGRGLQNGQGAAGSVRPR